MWLSIGLLDEIEFNGRGQFYYKLVGASLLATIWFFVFAGIMIHFFGIDIWAQFEKFFELLLKKQWQSYFSISPIYLLPFLVYFLNLNNIVFAVILDRRIAEIIQMPLYLTPQHPRLLDFKSPDWIIWPFLIALFGAFFKLSSDLIRIISLNLAGFLGCFYFFQGLAVLEKVLYLLRAGLLLRILVYLLIVSQLLIALTLIGLVDFWVDIRKQVIKRWFKMNK